MKQFIKISLMFLCLFGVWRCATVGKSFDFQGPGKIVVGKTTKDEIHKQYGDPFRVGFENGDLKWTYGFYHYSAFGPSDTKDLAITFDNNGVVKDYSYSTSLEEEKNELLKNPQEPQ